MKTDTRIRKTNPNRLPGPKPIFGETLVDSITVKVSREFKEIIRGIAASKGTDITKLTRDLFFAAFPEELAKTRESGNDT